jgi:hypothetical protein
MIDWLHSLFYGFVGLGASMIGAVSGLGSGIIVKPVLEFAIPKEAYVASLFSGISVFVMSLMFCIQKRKNIADKINGVQMNVALPMIAGSIIGGFVGNIIFARVKEVFHLDAVQGVGMIAVMSGLLLHQLFKHKIKPLQWSGIPVYLVLGTVLGLMAAFLGIGGGPLNVSALEYFAGMPIKAAALYSLFIIIFAQGANLIRWAALGGGWPLAHGELTLEVTLILLAATVAGSIAGALLGGVWYKKVSGTMLKKLYCGVLIFVIAVSAWNLWVALL